MSQRLVKLAASLQKKKYRIKEQLFIAEGEKLVNDLLKKLPARHLLCNEKWASQHTDLQTTIISETLMRKASALKHYTPILGIFEIPQARPFTNTKFPTLILDTIQDPGNLGTIIRTAAWFGIKQIICSPETADIYNPKVVQATMGALTMVNINYEPLLPFLQKMHEKNIPIFGTFLEGKNIYETNFPKNSIIIFGNEGQGISSKLEPFISNPITIPAFGSEQPESLNASVSIAVVCSEIMRTIQN